MKNLPANAGDGRDTALVLRSGRSPRRGNGNPLQYSCLGNLRCRCNDIMVAMDASSIQILISQFSSVAQSCPTLCGPMNRIRPGLPVHHHLPQFTQTHAHRVGDAIQPSHPLSSPSPPAPNLSQHQGLFQ